MDLRSVHHKYLPRLDRRWAVLRSMRVARSGACVRDSEVRIVRERDRQGGIVREKDRDGGIVRERQRGRDSERERRTWGDSV